ncbi:MAG: hypothetical protein RQ760_22305, partial [Sedimentisphaerales bacterium]|nr:hypothetical protein [Sedimentisphaerales bacterium]
MNLIIVHKKYPSVSCTADSSDSLLQFALTNEPVNGVVLDGLSRCLHWGRNGEFFYAIPKEWNIVTQLPGLKTVAYTDKVPICREFLQKAKRRYWLVISDGQFAAQIDHRLLNKLLSKIPADLVAVNVEPDLSGKQEKMRLTAQGKVAGFRRLYYDSTEPAPICNWPHYLFIKTNIFEQLLIDGVLPQSFPTLLENCRSNSLRSYGANTGGIVFDLETQEGLLNFCVAGISKMKHSKLDFHNSNQISQDSKLIGKVLLGKNIYIGPKTTLIGPAIVGNNVKIEQGVIINSSIIGSEVSVPKNKVVQNRIVKGPSCDWKQLTPLTNYSPVFNSGPKRHINESFRYWPRFSYTN